MVQKNSSDAPLSVGQWFLILLLFAIPIVNLIALIIFACGVGNANLVNYSRAVLLWVLLVFLFAIGIAILFSSELGL